MRAVLNTTGCKSIIMFLSDTAYPCENEKNNVVCEGHQLIVECMGMSKELASDMLADLSRRMKAEIRAEKIERSKVGSIPSPFPLNKK